MNASGSGGPALVGVNDTETHSQLTPGNYSVTLGDIAANCTLDIGENPRTLAVTAGNGLRIRLLFHPSLLSAADVEQFATDLTAILLRLAEQPAATVAGIRALLSPTVKGKAAALAEPKASAPHAPFVAPASEMENLVAQVWSELFGKQRISLDDNFFELGGHSLLLMRAHADLRARCVGTRVRRWVRAGRVRHRPRSERCGTRSVLCPCSRPVPRQ